MRMSMKQARVGINATQQEIAEKLGIHVQTYLKIERNPHQATVDQALRFSEIVGVPICDIFFGENSTKSRFNTKLPETDKNGCTGLVEPENGIQDL